MRFSKINGAFWVGVVAFVYFLIVAGKVFWTSYWLTKDAKQTVALITQAHSHGVVDYSYSVDDRQYMGASQRNWENEKYRNVLTGDQSIVYFSVSHPWVSSLETPLFPPRTTLFYFLVLLFTGGWVVLCVERSRPALVVQSWGSARVAANVESSLKWYQHIWVALPFLLLLFGGALGGACGGAAWTVNLSVFRRTQGPVLRYLWTGLVTILAAAVFAGFIWFALQRRKQ